MKRKYGVEYRLLVVAGDVEARLQPPKKTYEEVLRQARRHRKQDPDRDDGLHCVRIDWTLCRVSVEDFSGGQMEQG